MIILLIVSIAQITYISFIIITGAQDLIELFSSALIYKINHSLFVSIYR